MELDDLIYSNGKIDAKTDLPGGSFIRFRAENVSKQRTGLHAKIMLGMNQTLLAYSYFNLERDEERVRLANSAHRALGDSLGQLVTKEQLKHDLDIFTTHVWPKWIEHLVPSLFVGINERTAPQFALTPYVIQGGGTIIFGPPERMKTMTALTWAICIDAGLSWPFPVKQTPVMYVNLERGEESMQRRLGDLNRALGIEADRPVVMLNARGRSLADVEEGIAKAVERFDIKVGFLDSISRAGYGDLIDNRVANQTIDIMNRLFPTWVGIAHSPRNDSSHMFGSMHFEAGADVIVQLLTESQVDRTGVGFQVVKANDMKKPPLGTLAYEFDEFGVVRIYRPQAMDFPELMDAKSANMSLTEEIRLYLLGTGESSAQDIAKNIQRPRGSIAKLLASSAIFTQVRREGHQVYYGVVETKAGSA